MKKAISHSARMRLPTFSARMELIARRIQGIVPAQWVEASGHQRRRMPSSHSRSYAENPREMAPLTARPAEQGEVADEEEVGA